MKLTADMADQDPDKAIPRDLENAPPGTYQVEITSCDVVDPDNGKDRRIEVTARIINPDNYWPLRDYINVISEKAKWKYDQFLMSVGVLTPTKRKASWDPAAQVGKKVHVLVRSETRNVTGPDGTTEARTSAKIGGWLPRGTKSAAQAAGTVVPEESSTDEEISLEMHGAAADEGDEESVAYLTAKAEEHGIDPEEISTWAEVADAIGIAEGQEENTEDDTTEDEEVDLDELGGLADEEDEAAQQQLEELAAEADLDPNDYPTWAELAEALGKADAPEEGADSGSEEEAPDYASKQLNWLKKEAKEREIQLTGKETRAEVIARLEEWDEDPFSDE